MVFFEFFKKLPQIVIYTAYDKTLYNYYRKKYDFNGWGIHLFVGPFGSGKTSYAVQKAYDLAFKYPQLSVMSNIKLQGFPSWTDILPLNNAEDILHAPENTLILIDEIGTIFNSRDFSGGKCAVPKPLFQHLCQCRKRHLMIFGTVQRFNLLDKQIRDITADVTACHSHWRFPFVRWQTAYTFDIEEFELYSANRTYKPRCLKSDLIIQTNKLRNLYDTSELVDNMLNKEYLSDTEILSNREGITSDNILDKKQNKQLRKRSKW